MLLSSEYNMHVDGLLSANWCLITLLSSVLCSQFEIFRLQNVQMVNKAFSFNTIFIDNNRAELMTIPVVVELSHVPDNILPVKITAQPILGRGADTLHLTCLTRPQFHVECIMPFELDMQIVPPFERLGSIRRSPSPSTNDVVHWIPRCCRTFASGARQNIIKSIGKNTGV